MASYNEFTVQELEKAAQRVLSQNKRFTYSSNKLQPSERMRGKKISGGRRKSNRPSTPGINMSMKTSQQIYKNRQPGQSNSNRRYGRYNTNANASNKLKLNHDLPRRRRRSKSIGKDENYGSSRHRSNSRESSSGDEGVRFGKRSNLSNNKKQVLRNKQVKKKVSKKLKSISKTNTRNSSKGSNSNISAVTSKSGLSIVESEGQESTIAGFIKRFRDGEPSSPEVRSKQRRNNKNSFWWKSGDGGNESEISPSPARGSGKEAVARLREKSQKDTMSANSISNNNGILNDTPNVSNNKLVNQNKGKFNNNENIQNGSVPKKALANIGSDLDSRTKSVLDHCNNVLNTSDENNSSEKKNSTSETKMNNGFNEKDAIKNLDVRTKKVLEDCNEILSMNRIEAKSITVKEGANDHITFNINNKYSNVCSNEGDEEDLLDSDKILERAREALQKATEHVLGNSVIDKDVNGGTNTNINRNIEIKPTVKPVYNKDGNKLEFFTISGRFNENEVDLQTLDEALRATVRRGLFAF